MYCKFNDLIGINMAAINTIDVSGQRKLRERDAGEGLLIGFSAMALGSLLRYTTLIPTQHASLAGALLGGMVFYAGNKLLPIFRGGYEESKRDVSGLMDQKRFTLSNLLTSSIVGTIAGLATAAISSAAAPLVGIGMTVYIAHNSAREAEASRIAGGLPVDFISQERPPFEVNFQGRYLLKGCSSAREAFETLKELISPQDHDAAMSLILQTLFSPNSEALTQLGNSEIGDHYTYPGIHLSGILRELKNRFFPNGPDVGQQWRPSHAGRNNSHSGRWWF
jgi:hypothetical protein